jgi:hypothetical protein
MRVKHGNEIIYYTHFSWKRFFGLDHSPAPHYADCRRCGREFEIGVQSAMCPHNPIKRLFD